MQDQTVDVVCAQVGEGPGEGLLDLGFYLGGCVVGVERGVFARLEGGEFGLDLAISLAQSVST